MRLNKKGFTLVELLVVCAIMAIIVAVAVPSVVAYIDKAEEKSDKVFFESLNDNIYTSITQLNRKGIRVGVNEVLSEVYVAYNGSYDKDDPLNIKSKGDSPYLILPSQLPVKKYFPEGQSFCVLRMIEIKNGDTHVGYGYETLFYDADDTSAAKLTKRTKVTGLKPKGKAGVDYFVVTPTDDSIGEGFNPFPPKEETTTT